MKNLPTIYQSKTNVPGKMSKFGFNYNRRQVLLAVHKLYEHYFRQNFLKFYDKTDMYVRIRVEFLQNMVMQLV